MLRYLLPFSSDREQFTIHGVMGAINKGESAGISTPEDGGEGAGCTGQGEHSTKNRPAPLLPTPLPAKGRASPR